MKDNDTVYVQIGRGSGKTMIQDRQIEELIKSGKKVVLIEPKLTSKQTRGIRCEDIFTDRDILTRERMERADQILNMILKKSGDS